MTVFRRFLVIQALMLWQGGFLFYAAVVVPIGTDVLGSSLAQGRITRLVTNWLNLFGLVAVAIFAWEFLEAPAASKRVRRWLWGMWLIFAGGLGALFLIHIRLEGLVDFNEETIEDLTLFHLWHRTYLWISTIQWVAGLLFTALLMSSWRRSDPD
jgi:hypothetical protein